MLSYRKRATTTRIILHASHTPPSKSSLEAFLQVQGRRQGLLTIGYHYLIPRDGKPIATRPHDTIGSHCRYANLDSIGVCLAGGCAEKDGWVVSEDGPLPEDNFTPAQGDGLKSLIDHLQSYYGRLPLVGHSEANHKHTRQCPPTDMDAIRSFLA